MKKRALISIFLISILIFTACNGLFTTSLAEGAARDFDKALNDSATEDIADFLLSSPSLSKEDAEKLINVLSSRNPSELEKLSPEHKAAIVNTSIAAILPDTSSVAGLLYIESENSKDIINTAISSINSTVNTGALTTILGDPNLSGVSDDAVLLGTLCLVGSIASKNEVDITETTTSEGISSALTSANQAAALTPGDEEARLTAAAETAVGGVLKSSEEESAAIVNATKVFANSETAKELGLDISSFI